jgi:hypothetical protein
VLPSYFVSARHGTLVRSAAGQSHWQPFGVHHARRVGEPTTACGLTALDWRIFWEMPFPSEPSEPCEACFVAVAHLEEQRRNFRDLGEGIWR